MRVCCAVELYRNWETIICPCRPLCGDGVLDGVRHDVQVNIRWPLTGFAHPRLTSMNLEHSHAVNKEAIIVAAKMKAPLDYAMKRDAQLLTSDC